VKHNINVFVVNHWEYYKETALNEKGELFQSLTAYKRFAEKKGRYGDVCDLRAAAEVYHVPIAVHKGTDVITFGQNQIGRTLHLLFTGNTSAGSCDFLEENLAYGNSAVGNLPWNNAPVSCSSPNVLGFKGASVEGQVKSRHEPLENSTERPKINGQSGNASTKDRPTEFRTIHKRKAAKVKSQPSEFSIQTQNKFQALNSVEKVKRNVSPKPTEKSRKVIRNLKRRISKRENARGV